MLGFGALGEVPLGVGIGRRSLIAGAGAYVIAGQPANLQWGHKLALGAGAYVIAGQAATLVKTRPIALDGGSYAIAGQQATLTATRILSLQAGAYAIAGQDALLTRKFFITMEPGAYVINGQEAQFYYNVIRVRAGVSFPSYADKAAYAMVSGAADVDYPVANLGDFSSVRRLFKAAATGAVSFTAILPAAQLLRMIGLAHHNASAAETVRIRLFSDNNPDPTGNPGAIVHDSGAVAMFPAGAAPSARYAQVRPYILNVPVTARSMRIDLSANAAPWQIGMLEIANWWEWSDVSVSREFGLDNQDVVYSQPLDVDHVTSVWSPRTIRGAREVIDQSEVHTTALDFINEKMMDRPFVWLWDYGDPATWVREAIVVVNADLPPPVANDYPSGSFTFSFGEFMR